MTDVALSTRCQFSTGPPDINIVVVGDSYVGKTSLLKTFVTREFPNLYDLPSFERYFEDITVDSQDFHLIIWEPVALESYETMREFIYGKADCIIICYSVNDIESCERVITYWFPEVQKYCKEIPVVLAALKTDLRTKSFSCISYCRGKDMKVNINASSFVESSSLLGIGVEEVFFKAVQCVLNGGKCKVT